MPTFTDYVISGSDVLNVAKAKLYIGKTNDDGSYTRETELGYIQGLTINLSQQVERAVELGSDTYIPFVGVQVVTGTMRRAIINKTTYQKTIAKEFGADSEFDVLHFPQKTVEVEFELSSSTNVALLIENLTVTSWSVAINAGAVIIFEDINFEAESVKKKS